MPVIGLGISFTLVLFLQPQPAIDALANRFPDVLFSVCTDQKVAALTIDDSPSGTTSILLDTLKRHNSHATFFVLGHKINYRRDILNQILSEGHEIGNHMQNQDASYKLDIDEFRKQLLDVQKLISSIENYDSSSHHWFRPGSGIINDEMVSIAKEEGFRLVLGNVHPFDPQLPYKKVITQHVIARTRPGSIIILHDKQPSVDSIEDILTELIDKQGYRFVTLSELIKLESKSSGKL
eukprot:526849_1